MAWLPGGIVFPSEDLEVDQSLDLVHDGLLALGSILEGKCREHRPYLGVAFVHFDHERRPALAPDLHVDRVRDLVLRHVPLICVF
jgi:hypothetical protein